MYFDVLNKFSSLHFLDWKPLKVGNRSVNLPIASIIVKISYKINTNLVFFHIKLFLRNISKLNHFEQR